MTNFQLPDDETRARTARLSSYFNSVVRGKRIIKAPTDAKLYLEAICTQEDHAECMEKLYASPPALDALHTALRFDISPAFVNGPLECLILVLAEPSLKQICGGDLVRKLVTVMVEPPTVWHALVQHHGNKILTERSERAFAWLLLELLIWPEKSPIDVYSIAQSLTESKCFITSSTLETRTIGNKIQHVLQNVGSKLPISDTGPGGRHDNDFVDFRKIAIHPTEDELLSLETPFYRRADAVQEAPAHLRVATHLDNQFRLLREDMLGELRQDIKISQQPVKGKKMKLKLGGLAIHGSNFQEKRKRLPFALTVTCQSGLEKFSALSRQDRKAYLKAHDNRNFLKHQSFGCLVDRGRIIAFATILRSEDLLVDEKYPVVTLGIQPGIALENALLSLKTSRTTDFVMVETAMFAYEPVLTCLQSKLELPLAKEILSLEIDQEKDEGFSPLIPSDLLLEIEDGNGQDLKDVLGTEGSVSLDDSQRDSLLSGLKNSVSLIQGPPGTYSEHFLRDTVLTVLGTGKSFIGALLAKAFHMFTGDRMLVLAYTNHALDQFLEDLLDIGIPSRDMIRLGSKSSSRTACLSLYNQSDDYRRSQATWDIINSLESQMKDLETSIRSQLSKFAGSNVSKAEIFSYLEFSDEDSDSHIFHALQVPDQSDGMSIVGKAGRSIDRFYLYDRWAIGQDAGVFHRFLPADFMDVWNLQPVTRRAKIYEWNKVLLEERISNISKKVKDYNACQRSSSRAFDEKTVEIFRGTRIIACTTTAAAKYTHQLQSASPGVVLVEEAGEILESHVLTAMTPHTKQLILIGDHEQLRPKVNNYALTVAKGDGYDLNRSLFERLILSGFPHTTLSQQHRMCPEISSLVRQLTYPKLLDAPKTKNRPPIRGLWERVIFINHSHLEDQAGVADRRDQGASISRQNTFEVGMVLKMVKYMAQQGYGTANQVVLTPYLGQLSLLRRELSKDNDPVLNDLDSFDLVKAGLLPAASANHSKQPIKLSTIGEESDIVIATLTRSNRNGDIGFMAEPERLNVLLSRARDALIIIGNVQTFMTSWKGQKTWKPFLDNLSEKGLVFDGLPVKCEQHPDKKNILKSKEDFLEHCPDGGCAAPCGAKLICGIHECPQRCHQLSDHSKMKCKQIMKSQCPQKHEMSYLCFKKRPEICPKCESEAREKAKQLQRDHDLELERERLQKAYAQQLADVKDEIAYQRNLMQNRRDQAAQQATLQQYQKDLESLKAGLANASLSNTSNGDQRPELSVPTTKPQEVSPEPTSTSTKSPRDGNNGADGSESGVPEQSSPAKDEWEHQKKFEGVKNDALDELMDMIGLENVKDQFLSIKAKVDTAVRQCIDLKSERFGITLLGNPGTGKTTVARLYAKFLSSVGALPGSFVVETTGARLANEGVTGCKKHVDDILNNGGGAMFIDEAYQLTSGNNSGGGSVLDFLLAEVENLTGKVVFILAGYNKQMETLLAHNPGIPSRFPNEMQFKDYEDAELLKILKYRIDKRYSGRMEVELGMKGLNARIVSRRIGRGRGKEGFGNARAVENMVQQITNRQAKRLRQERRAGKATKDLMLTTVDLLGPEPSDVLSRNTSWAKLQELTGLGSVKESVQALFDSIISNYQRELKEQPLVEYSLNKVFLGSPGTGKTTVAKLYGQILADIGLLSSGEDFVGSVLGGSEAATKGILASTVGKVLVIDEAYGLYGGKQGDPYKTAVIDTIVAEVQSVPGDDRCVLLIGYKQQMEDMFQNVNPGLTRRFPLDSAFVFEDFTDAELHSILDFKLARQGFQVTAKAKKVALEILSRARNRPHFGNAGEVDILLNTAKVQQQKRITKTKSSMVSMFEPEDFDPDFARGDRAVTNITKLFEGTVGCEEVIAQLQGYQMTVANMRARDMDPREQIPFAFLFRGPPGTGKTTTARRMGKVYYDMGFLSTAEVIECSASDLVGEYIGHTGPKTQKCLEKALGKVLFIDEAYRLAEGHFAKEAMDEIVDCLTKPQFAQKLVVILAGYEADINRLMSINPGLTSRFPETVVFKGMDPQACSTLLCQLLRKKKALNAEVLESVTSNLKEALLRGFESLSRLDNWGSARDVQTIVKAVFGKILRSADPSEKTLDISAQTILDEMNKMIAERTQRSQNLVTAVNRRDSLHLPQAFDKPRENNPINTSTSQELKIEQAKDVDKTSRDEEVDIGTAPLDDPSASKCERDAGVTDAVWQQLQSDKKAAEDRERAYQETLREEKELRKAIDDSRVQDESEKQPMQEDDDDAKATKEALCEREQLRISKQLALIEIERKREEFEKKRQEAAAINKKMQLLGVCCMGYRWIKQSSGYRCAGGSHFMSNERLGLA
ncbi:hypothetical protein MBLNU459_g7605t2 [Dothideomycetes sp. NU459]